MFLSIQVVSLFSPGDIKLANKSSECLSWFKLDWSMSVLWVFDEQSQWVPVWQAVYLPVLQKHRSHSTEYACMCVRVLALSYALVLCVGKLYLSDINPVAYNTVCGLRIFLSPLQVVGIVVSFLDSDWVRCVKVELSIVGLCWKVRSRETEKGVTDNLHWNRSCWIWI